MAMRQPQPVQFIRHTILFSKSHEVIPDQRVQRRLGQSAGGWTVAARFGVDISHLEFPLRLGQSKRRHRHRREDRGKPPFRQMSPDKSNRLHLVRLGKSIKSIHLRGGQEPTGQFGGPDSQ
jgi:hypothetical protein